MVANSIFPDYDTSYNEVVSGATMRVGHYAVPEKYVGAGPRLYRGLSMIDKTITAGSTSLYQSVANDSAAPSVGIALLTSGSGTFVQGRHKVFVKEGDILLWSGAWPVASKSESTCRCTSLVAHTHLIAQLSPSTQNLIKREAGRSAIGAFLKSHIQAFRDAIDDVSDTERQAILHMTIDLLASYFSPDNSIGVKSDYHRRQLERIRDYLHENPIDNSFTPQVATDACGISKRSLHKIFEGTNTTFSEWVRHERLAMAARALASDNFRTDPITHIAIRFGFYDSSHFTRCFKHKYGFTPRQYRENHQDAALIR